MRATGDGQRRWASTEATRNRIVDAAVEVFHDRGFAAATIAEIVQKSGDSSGSIYHHFGGKNELFMAILTRVAADNEARIADAIARTESDGYMAGFEAQARAYFEGIWANRRAARVLTRMDAPPGYDQLRREAMAERFRRWMTDLDLENSRSDILLSQLLIASMAEGAILIAQCEEASAAEEFTDAAVGFIRRLIVRDGTATPG